MSKVINESCTRRKIPPPQLVLIHLPPEPIQNGKNRRKFPSSKDCFVKVAVSNISAGSGSTVKEHVRVRYESNSGERNTLEKSKSLINGSTYLLGISDITRHPITAEESKLPDLPVHKVCQYLPLNYYPGKDTQPGHYGFWFRFFGKSCKFHILITLKLHKHAPGDADKVVSTIELDIRNIPRYAMNKNIPKISSSSKLSACSFYSEQEYIGIMEKLQKLQEQCLWEKCASVGDEMLFGLEKGKSDLKACIMLEQSKAVCHLGSPGDDSTVIAEGIISTLSDCYLPLETKCRFYVLKALVLQHQCSHDTAVTNAKHALDFAKTGGLYIEKHLIVKCLKLNC
ncbi:uncharacterized protein LOC114521266 isoform X2 [Dendronephthya gigantea]|uniref:uncharacterized protein LOC114521266 isoform X2 n=1 Tax=Dendronephthya gigantea TaxID=151771 RepID=UPI00106B64C7|nr:uncharacterized protein LOC114521266 isoform X2 [Dendronephthya gigantea]